MIKRITLNKVSILYPLLKGIIIISEIVGSIIGLFAISLGSTNVISYISNHIFSGANVIATLIILLVISLALYENLGFNFDFLDYCDCFVASKKCKLFYAFNSLLGATLLTNILSMIVFRSGIALIISLIFGVVMAVFTYNLEKLDKEVHN